MSCLSPHELPVLRTPGWQIVASRGRNATPRVTGTVRSPTLKAPVSCDTGRDRLAGTETGPALRKDQYGSRRGVNSLKGHHPLGAGLVGQWWAGPRRGNSTIVGSPELTS